MQRRGVTHYMGGTRGRSTTAARATRAAGACTELARRPQKRTEMGLPEALTKEGRFDTTVQQAGEDKGLGAMVNSTL